MVAVSFDSTPNNPMPTTTTLNFGSLEAGTESNPLKRYVSHDNVSEIFDCKLFLSGTDASTVINWANGGIYVSLNNGATWTKLTGNSYETGLGVPNIGVHEDPDGDGVFSGELPIDFKVVVPSDAVAKSYIVEIYLGFHYYEA